MLITRLFSVLFACGLVGSAIAEDEPALAVDAADAVDAPQALPVLKDRTQALSMLNHEDYVLREHATSHLLRDDTLDRAGLRELFVTATTPEQRNRLIYIAEHHILRLAREQDFALAPDAPNAIRRSSVGFSYDILRQNENPIGPFTGLVIRSTMPGFPAYAYFKPGDIVIEINDTDIRETFGNPMDWVREQIASRQAGQEITFKIFRDGAYQDLRMVCAQWAALNQMYNRTVNNVSVRSEQYNRVWAKAYEELTGDLPAATRLQAEENR